MNHDPPIVSWHATGSDPQPTREFLAESAAHPEELAHLVEGLHRPVRDATTLLDLMGRACREAVRVLQGVHWAGVIAQFGDRPFTGTDTDQRVLVVDERQYLLNDGPCLRAMRTNALVSITLAEVTATWPTLGSTAARVGVNSFLAVPLHAHDESVGALNLYSSEVILDRVDQDLLGVVTQYLHRGLTDFSDLRPQPTSELALRRAMAGWVVVEKAIGMMMSMFGYSSAYARDVLSDQAEDWGRTLTEQAELFIEESDRPS